MHLKVAFSSVLGIKSRVFDMIDKYFTTKFVDLETPNQCSQLFNVELFTADFSLRLTNVFNILSQNAWTI